MKNNKKSFFEIFKAIKSYEMEREKITITCHIGFFIDQLVYLFLRFL